MLCMDIVGDLMLIQGFTITISFVIEGINKSADANDIPHH